MLITSNTILPSQPDIQRFTVIQFVARQPLVFFRAIAGPPYEILYAVSPFLFIQNAVNEVFMLRVDDHRCRSFELTCRVKCGIVFYERQNLEVWKVGKVRGLFGRLSVMVEMSGDVSVIIYGPLYHGMNFATRFLSLALYSRCQWSIDNTTWPSFSK
jgi:hypothetical protein